MKAVTAKATLIELGRQRQESGFRGHRRVKCRIEAGDLRQFRQAGRKGANCGKVVGLMVWRQGSQFRQSLDDLAIEARRLGELRPAMDDAMSDPGKAPAMSFGLEPVKQADDGRRVIGHGVRHRMFLARDGETRVPPDAGDLPLDSGATGKRQIVECEFYAG